MNQHSTPTDVGTEHDDATDEDAELLELLDESDEDQTDEGEGEAELDEDEDGTSDEEDDAEGGSDDQSESGRFVQHDGKVRLSDGTVTTVGELVRGNLREADYTRKNQSLADERREMEARVSQREQELARDLEWTQTVLQAIAPQRPDPALMETDWMAYQRQLAAFDQWRDLEGALKGKASEAYSRWQEEQSSQREQWIEQEKQSLETRIPELRDPKKVETFMRDIASFAGHYGLTEDEVRQGAGSRELQVLHDAIKWRKLQAKKGKALGKAKGKPPVKPGRREAPSAGKARASANDLKTLRSTGGRGPEGEAAAIRLLEDFV